MKSQSWSEWSFRSKILLPIVAVVLTTSALAAFGLYWVTNRSDHVSVERQIRTTQRAIDDRIARLALEQETVSVWDETADIAGSAKPDLSWIHNNTGLWLRNIFGHDETYILDARDRAIYASLEGRVAPALRFERIRHALNQMIDETRGRVAAKNNRFDRHPGQPVPGDAVLTTGRAIHDTQMIELDGRPAAVSVMQIRHSSPELRTPGAATPLMVAVRYLDGSFLTDLERSNMIDAPRFSRRADRRVGESILPLHSENDSLIGFLTWRPELPGSRILAVLAPMVAALIAAMVGLMAILARWLKRSTGELKDALVQLRASEAQAQHLAFHDSLTGLPNRALFNDRLEHALNRVRRGERLAVLTLDLDRFKHVNDTLGHLAGDALIREFASRMTAIVRAEDTVARLGGDEFAVLLPGVGDAAQIEALCARILDAVRDRFEISQNSAFVGASIGVVVAPDCGLDRVELMRRADIALYRAKAEGGGVARLFTDTMDAYIRSRREIENSLRAAIDSPDQLGVHYQPVLGPDGVTPVGLEALVRWTHPERGPIPPEQFVSIAEETGLICPLGEKVLEEACTVARRCPGLFVAVNLSPVQLREEDIADRIIAIVRKAGVSPARIELEITEGALLEEDERISTVLKRLREAGFGIALDDFGTGYCSLSYLHRFQVDKIKIDRSFVQRLGQDADCKSLIEAIVMIGRTMGLTITAEGVETEEHRRFLAAAGCHQMQGYLFSRPRPFDEIATWLRSTDEKRAAA